MYRPPEARHTRTGTGQARHEPPDRPGAGGGRPPGQLVGDGDAVAGRGCDDRRPGYATWPADRVPRRTRSARRAAAASASWSPGGRAIWLDVDADGGVLVADRDRPRLRRGGGAGRDEPVEPVLELEAGAVAQPPVLTGVGGVVPEAVDRREHGEAAGAERDHDQGGGQGDPGDEQTAPAPLPGLRVGPASGPASAPAAAARRSRRLPGRGSGRTARRRSARCRSRCRAGSALARAPPPADRSPLPARGSAACRWVSAACRWVSGAGRARPVVVSRPPVVACRDVVSLLPGPGAAPGRWPRRRRPGGPWSVRRRDRAARAAGRAAGHATCRSPAQSNTRVNAPQDTKQPHPHPAPAELCRVLRATRASRILYAGPRAPRAAHRAQPGPARARRGTPLGFVWSLSSLRLIRVVRRAGDAEVWCRVSRRRCR